MVRQGKKVIRNYMTLEYEFTGIRIQDGYLTPVDWNLTANLLVLAKNNILNEDIEYKASVAFQKLYYWLDTNMPDIAMVDVDNEDDLFIANMSSNITMYCPGNPGDDILIQLLHAKLTSLLKSCNVLEIGEMTLKGSDLSLKYTFDCPDGDYMLPTETKEYFINGETRDEIPWWFRDDGFCFEFIKPEDLEISSEELFKDIVDPMTEFEKFIEDMSETHIGEVKEPARIVQVEKWKPKKV